MKKTAVCWSGGKDCCLALDQLLKEKHEMVCLLSMVSKEHARNHAHGIQLEILRLQAEALGLPLVLVNSAGDYETSLKKSLVELKENYGVEAIGFGSLYMESDREWNEQVAVQAGLEPLFPVWIKQDQASELLHEFISSGYEAVVCRASSEHFDQTWAGRMLDERFYEDILKTECCAMGELGEYHTFVLDGPLFQKKLEIKQSEVILNAGLWSLDIQTCRLVDKKTLVHKK
ncbi:diphthine--ammonia ligase [Fictibacillus phosphorivorans]|uniref:Dph6-related ATP pyrophosphatase n=1 Tax=Fictibacillus phosphorivorans TaxID=1221500 RepID=UPI00203E95F6|nr:diphthine--ammonia ligase [Fictibacillus phosphorivorans]MCM3718136.1 diphthine--ammonia ligase [Fictibacillus phosphorivorans]MCM3775763.1 diphthine--ammonia ligase [Fictibacillus phosphorivorans]